MNTMQEQFEVILVLYRPHAEKMTFENSEGVTEYWNPVENLAWKMWQAAIETTKATSVAPTDIRVKYADYFAAIERAQEALQKIAALKLSGPAEAARQPAPALPVKTWQERLKESASDGWTTLSETHMQAEITELRAALAATAAPVLSDEQIDHIARSYFADEHGQTKAKGVIHDALRQVGVADAGTVKEAERYRYLRSVVYPEKFYASGHPSWVIRYHLRGETFDSAVDHAIIAAINWSQP